MLVTASAKFPYDIFYNIYTKIDIFKKKKKKAVTHLKKTAVILQPCLPMMVTSLQWPLCPVPKVAIVQRFNCDSLTYQ